MQETLHQGFWSLLPPLIAIVLAILTKQVFISLIFGIFVSTLLTLIVIPVLYYAAMYRRAG